MKTNRTMQLWKQDKPAFGIWCDLGSAPAVEGLTLLKPDWLLLDGEHGLASYEEITHLMRAMNGAETTAIVRVPWNEPVGIKRVLDLGAEGIMVPFIRSAAEVRDIVSMCNYPPKGARGIGPFRASGYETDFPDYMKRANDEIAVIVQIENTDAVADLDNILAVEGLDAIFIGPSDLSASMGLFPNLNAPEVEKVIAEVLAKARAVKMPVGIYCGKGEAARKRVEQGFRMVNVGNDVMYLLDMARRELKAVRDLRS